MRPELAAVFSVQGGRVRRSQALDLGETPASISGRLGCGEWVESAPGVYAIAGTPAGAVPAMWDVVLSFPPGKLRFARRTAARLHLMAGFRHEWPWPLEAVVQEDVTRRKEVSLWRATDWDRRTPDAVDGLPVTPRDETVADLAAVCGVATTMRVLQNELFQGRLQLSDARRWLGRGRRGSGVLRQACNHLEARRESVLTVIVFEICIAAGFPPPDCGVDIPGVGVCDLCYLEARLVIEPRGFGPHGTYTQWHRDGDRDDALRDRNLECIVVRWRDAVRRQGAVANRISRPLARHGLIPAELQLPPGAVLVPGWSERYGDPVGRARRR